MTLQTTDSTTKAVCFSPEKRAVLQNYQNEKSPVKITKYRTSNKYGREDIVIEKTTIVNTINAENAPEYKELDLSPVPTITSLNQVSAEQLVTLKANVAKVNGSKIITTSSRNPTSQLKKQDVIIVDPTASMRLILWEEYIDCLETNKTYLFKNLRLKQDSAGNKFLNTPKSDMFT